MANLAPWREVFLGIVLLGAALCCRANDAAVFQPELSGDRLTGKDWLAVYSHLSEIVKTRVEPVEGQSFANAAVVELLETAPPEAVGKATYFRSRAIPVQAGRFSVEWYENVPEDVGGPHFELWGEVGTRPADFNRLLLQFVRKPSGFELASGTIVPVETGWRHFKIVVSAEDNTCDFYYEDMEHPVITGVPLKESIENTNRLGIGFIWYLNPGTPPAKWQIGGISVQPIL